MIIGLDAYKQQFNVASETVIRPGLTNMIEAMKRLQQPQLAYKVMHVAGTNGKGSTVTYAKEIAQLHGLKVGTFMSPGIVDVHDQIVVNGQPISSQQLGIVFQQMHKAGLSGLCTDFELLTCAAFVHFQNEQVDVAMIEAGLGGRFDSTNVVEPVVSIITSIALEHTNFLGDTLQQVAAHKAGIVKRGAPAVIGHMSDEVFDVFEQEAALVGTKLARFGRDFTAANGVYEDNESSIANLQPRMRGVHQLHNAALAIQALQHVIQLQPRLIQQAVATASLPFRFEQITPNLYFDGAHNPASIEALVETLRQQCKEPVQLVVGILADKDVAQVLRLLETVSDDFIFVDFENSRAMKAEQLLQLSNAKHKRIEVDIVSYLSTRVESGHTTVVTGSLYLLASIREQVLARLSV